MFFVRLARDERTRQYLARRQAEGKTKTEAIRCLKRYLARELFRLLPAPNTYDEELKKVA